MVKITWIFKNYNPSRIEWWRGYGFFTLFTDTPALLGHGSLVTLTIAGTPVIFVPRAAKDTFETGPPTPDSMFYCNLSIPGPLPRFKVHRWTGLSIMEAQMTLNHLNSICKVHALNLSSVRNFTLNLQTMDDDMSQGHCRIVLLDGRRIIITILETMHSGKMQYPCIKERSGERNSSFLENEAMECILVLGLLKPRILQPVLCA